MNRKEKIERAAWNFAPMPYNEGKDWDEVKSANLRAGFKEGHEQGWKDAVEKACEYLKTSHEDIGIRYIRGHEVEDEIEIFKNYMEGQQ